ncbi:DNA repair protein [Scheffersomyces stipitis CBS 6054]|uniref:DNA repair protein n=1 Tax=Scheffersomyces stipitis (strain ATCC 58785 / CBS 6054 / NBRC 10063 / NRRL Y-11545) TaxID=322104 RepID=A3LW79_PICST|nr:DNA repair protein [Scheffersomyces stipitis CBS 6054]ABN67237.2 DNA repair protein [Scheffersomyces stipitis CBS 6054]
MKHSVGSDSEEYLLEELPKWHELGNMLDDIFHEKSLSSENSGPILIMCSDTRTARQLYQVIESMKEIKVSGKKYFSSRRFMISKLHEYLQWKEINNLSKQLNEDLEKSEDQTEEQIITSKSFTRNGQPASKRRRTRGASSTARVAKLYSGENRGAVDIDENVLGQMDQEIVESEEDDVVETGPTGLFVETEDIIVPSLSHINMGDQVIIQVYDEGRNDALLQEISPSYIIMYEPNLSFIRRTEIFQAINRDQPAKVFVMFYSNSTEEQKYLLRLKKEKDAFTKLIREKASLSKHFETSEDNYKFQIQRNQTMNTRIAGGASFRTTDEMRIVVDSREFGASLPNLLYRIGIKVVPCMLTVGDYVISPKICVERKAIPDLVSSFKSGRLFTQCSQMFKHYETPTLLIEFDENKSFSLQQYADSRFLKGRAETANDSPINQSLQSKIMELLVAYPKLKIIWSSSPYETAQIFMSLKANQEEPDVESALNKGVSKEVITEDGGPPNFNDDPIDFIQNIPGINDMNYYKIIQNVRNLEELVQLSKEQFVKLLGKENGKKAYNFINHRIK